MLPNKDEASKMSDLNADHLLIVRRLNVVNEPFDHLFSIIRGCIYAASSRHLWAYSRNDYPLFFSVLIGTMQSGAILVLNR